MHGLEQRRASDESPEQGRIRAAAGFTEDLQRTIYGSKGSPLFLSSPSLVEQHHINNDPKN